MALLQREPLGYLGTEDIKAQCIASGKNCGQDRNYGQDD